MQLQQYEVTKSQLINLLYDYMRLYRYSCAKLIFHKRTVDLYLKDDNYIGISKEEAYSKLHKLTTQRNGLGQGYAGRSMSINARQAYERGMKPLSKITAEDLKRCGFHYSLDFFKWLVKSWKIRPKERHHTSASYHNTNFYDDSTIRHLAIQCDLGLLYRIYRGDITKKQAKREKGIQYAKVRVQDSVLGGKAGKWIHMNCILCGGIVFYSQKLCFRADDERLEILEIYDNRPDSDFENKHLENLSVKLIKNKLSFYKRYIRQ